MSINKRQISKGALVNLVGIGLGVLLNLWLFPKVFSTEELGVYRWLERSTVLLSNVLLLGMHRSFTKFASDSSNNEHTFNRVFFKYSSTAIGLAGVALWLLGPEIASWYNLQEHAQLVRTLGLLTAGSMAFLMATSVSATTKRIVTPLFLKNIGIRLAMGGLALEILTYNTSFNKWVYGYGIAFFVLGLGALFYAWSRIGVKPFAKIKEPLANGSAIAKFARYSILTTLVGFGLSTIDMQMLALLTGMDNVGIYSIAFFIGTVMDGVRRPINQMLAPQIAQGWNTNNRAVVLKLYQKTSIVQMIFNAAFIILVLSNLPFIFSLIPDGQRFDSAMPVVFWILLGRFIDTSFGSNGEIIGNSPYYRFNLYISSLLILMVIVLNLYFIPEYGILGVAYSSVISLLLFNLSRFAFIYYKTKMQPFTMQTMAVICIALLTGAITYFIPLEGFLGAVCKSAVIATVGGIFHKSILRIIKA